MNPNRPSPGIDRRAKCLLMTQSGHLAAGGKYRQSRSISCPKKEKGPSILALFDLIYLKASMRSKLIKFEGGFP